jgi:hypothetical protein
MSQMSLAANCVQQRRLPPDFASIFVQPALPSQPSRLKILLGTRPLTHFNFQSCIDIKNQKKQKREWTREVHVIYRHAVTKSIGSTTCERKDRRWW